MFYPDVKKHISPSALATWYNAKQSFIKSYFEGEPFTGNSATEFGALVHSMLEGGFLPAKKAFDQCEVTLTIPLQNGVVALGTPDSFTSAPKYGVIEVVDYKTGKDDGWSAEEIAGDLKVKFTCWLALQSVRQAGHNPEYVKASIESFQTFYNPRKKKLELMPNDESEVYEFMFRAEDLDGFTSVIEKTVTEINQAYMKWLESTDEFVDKEAVKEFAEISAQIAQLEIRAKELKERIGEQMVFGNKDSVGTDYGTFYFTTRKTYDYPKTLKVDYLDYGLTLEDTEAINACVKAVKTDYELSHEPVSVSRSVGFKPKRAK